MSAQRAPKHICIAGAGIAGLTLALALGKLGARVTVLERNDGIQEYGAGLQVSPNARHALNSLGLDAALETAGFEPEAIDLFPFRAQKPITSLILGDTVRQRYGLPYIVMHRADLAQALFLACKRFANIDIRFGVKKFELKSFADRVEITYHGQTEPPQNITAAAFVGADGVHSHTRTSYLGGQAAVYSGYVAWRALLDINELAPDLSITRTSLLWGPRFHAVVYPLPHRGTINIALFAKETSAVAVGSDERPSTIDKSLQDPRFAKIIGLVKQWRQWPLSTVQTSRWHEGRVGLIGDAAHAMLPFQAQGAGMGIESAAMLAPLLMQHDDPATAFDIYKKQRLDRVTRVAKLSEKNGEIFHLRQPMSLARDIFVKTRGPKGHLPSLDWLYEYRHDSDAAAI